MGPAEESVSFERDPRPPPHAATEPDPSPAARVSRPALVRTVDASKKDAGRTEIPQEADIWWGAYSSRTMLPSFMVCGLLTALAALGAVYLLVRYEFDPLMLRYSVYGIAAVVWLWQVLRWSYRVLTFSYRVTTQRLLLERSFFNSGRRTIALRQIAKVLVEQDGLEQCLGVGQVKVICDRGPTQAMTLAGVYDPQRVASLIADAVEQAR